MEGENELFTRTSLTAVVTHMELPRLPVTKHPMITPIYVKYLYSEGNLNNRPGDIRGLIADDLNVVTEEWNCKADNPVR